VRLIESEIRELKLRILDMADLVRVQLDSACVALSDHNADMAQRVLKKEREVDKLDNKINRRCERIIALYQPVANDLRFVFSVLRINGYLENIGDQGSGIAHKLLQVSQPFSAELLARVQMPLLQQQVKQILFDALRAYFKDSPEASRAIFQQDDAIDDIHHAAFAVVVEAIQQDPAHAADYIHLLHIVKHLEKVGDLAVSIAEEALFHTEGVTYRHSELKYAHKLEAPEAPETLATA